MRKRTFLMAGLTAATMLVAPLSAAAEDMPYGLMEGKPFEGTKLSILSVVTPQFDGLMLRDKEFTELTGIETEWTFIPFGSLQEKINAEGIAANGTFDVVNYLDSWGPPNAHWLMRIDEMMARDGDIYGSLPCGVCAVGPVRRGNPWLSTACPSSADVLS